MDYFSLSSFFTDYRGVGLGAMWSALDIDMVRSIWFDQINITFDSFCADSQTRGG